MTAENPTYWGLVGDESLSCDDIGERLQDFIDGLDPDNPIPETIEMVGFDPVPIHVENETADISGLILDKVLEYLDECYSVSREFEYEPTEKMEEAAKKCAKKILEEYNVYDCEEVCRKTVKISDYLNENKLTKI
jgi:hypothetical protein